ncbi:hypothetical protein CYMTET_35240 [Cymbomonas tetramitiformis]|uniref:PNPLA domain-containing protein n=1 Tax=Cymbomonas tetramitiformis TaxID=36881 RepID=A0AAE0F9K4_9CHLO|nr:hypothetical protein CYMTET_35240 [Cymbomonas tetramitiformis]
MYPYHLGVANYIAEHFDVSDLRSAGASGGFTGAVTLAADVTEEEHWECLQTAKELWASRLLGPFLIQTKEWMAPYYHVLLKHESALLEAQRDGRITIGVTTIFPRESKWPLAHKRIDTFSSVKEFAYTVTCSQRILPFYRLPGKIEGQWTVDGGLSSLFTFPKGADPRSIVRVAPWGFWPLSDIHPSFPYAFYRFFMPPSRKDWEAFVSNGYDDARRNHHVFINKGFRPRQQCKANVDAQPSSISQDGFRPVSLVVRFLASIVLGLYLVMSGLWEVTSSIVSMYLYVVMISPAKGAFWIGFCTFTDT